MKHLCAICVLAVIVLSGCVAGDAPLGPEGGYPEPSNLRTQQQIQETHEQYLRTGDI